MLRVFTTTAPDWAGSDKDSSARLSISYYRPIPRTGWYWLAHSHLNNQAIIVQPLKPWATKRASGFRKVWDDHGSGASHSYSAWIPYSDDPDYRALGVVLKFRAGDYNPPDLAELVMVHKDALAEATYEPKKVWSTNGSMTSDVYCDLWAVKAAGEGIAAAGAFSYHQGYSDNPPRDKECSPPTPYTLNKDMSGIDLQRTEEIQCNQVLGPRYSARDSRSIFVAGSNE